MARVLPDRIIHLRFPVFAIAKLDESVDAVGWYRSNIPGSRSGGSTVNVDGEKVFSIVVELRLAPGFVELVQA
jgi:hypothetical protein